MCLEGLIVDSDGLKFLVYLLIVLPLLLENMAAKNSQFENNLVSKKCYSKIWPILAAMRHGRETMRRQNKT